MEGGRERAREREGGREGERGRGREGERGASLGEGSAVVLECDFVGGLRVLDCKHLQGELPLLAVSVLESVHSLRAAVGRSVALEYKRKRKAPNYLELGMQAGASTSKPPLSQ